MDHIRRILYGTPLGHNSTNLRRLKLFRFEVIWFAVVSNFLKKYSFLEITFSAIHPKLCFDSLAIVQWCSLYRMRFVNLCSFRTLGHLNFRIVHAARLFRYCDIQNAFIASYPLFESAILARLWGRRQLLEGSNTGRLFVVHMDAAKKASENGPANYTDVAPASKFQNLRVEIKVSPFRFYDPRLLNCHSFFDPYISVIQHDSLFIHSHKLCMVLPVFG